MKKLIITTSLLFCTMMMLKAQQTINRVTIDQPQQVVIDQHADTLTISVTGQKDNPDYQYMREVKIDDQAESHTLEAAKPKTGLGWDFSIMESNDEHPFSVDGVFGAGLSFGFGMPLGAPSGMGSGRTTEANFDIINFRFMEPGSKWWATWSIGLGMKFIQTGKNHRFLYDRDGNISLGDYENGVNPVSSDIFLLEDNFSLMFHRWMNKTRSLAFGATWILRDPSTSFCRTTYEDTDWKKVTDVGMMKGIHTQRFSFSMRYENYGTLPYFIYAKFSPWSEFRDGRGPSFSNFTVGLGLTL